MNRLTRRDFTRLSAVLAANAVLLAACGGSASAPAASGSSAAAASPAGSAAAKTSAAGSGAAGQRWEPNAEVQKIYEAAKSEGAMEVWTTMEPAQTSVVFKAFTTDFPGISPKAFQIRIEDALSRYMAEMSANGKTTADAIEGNLPGAKVLVDRKIVEPFDWPSLGVPANRNFGEWWGLTWYQNASALTYNTDMLKANELPKSWAELGDPKWKNKLILEYRAFPILSLYPFFGEDQTVELIRKIKANNPIIIQGQSTVLEAGLAGQAPVMIGPPSYRIPQEKKKGAPVAFVPDLEAGVRAVGMMVGKGAHPNAARLYAWWMASPQGQETVVKVQAGLLTPDATDDGAVALRDAHIKLMQLTADQEIELGNLSKKVQPIIGG
jgi:iron(III) transport system substrate-binding protein